MKFVRLSIALLGSISCLAFATTGANAANRFLTGPVPVLGDPLLNSNSGDFDIAQSDSGEAVAFWGQSTGMYASIRPAGGKFGAPVLISTNGGATSLPQVAMAPNGATTITWRGKDGGLIDQVYSATKTAGFSTFTAAVQVSSETFTIPNIDPHVDIADSGIALVVWRGYDINANDNSSRIRQRYVNAAGAPTGAPLPISPVSATGNAFPDVAVGPNGHALITYTVGDSITGDQATYYEGPANANPDTEVFNNNAGAGMAGAVDAAGTAVIAYKVGNTVIGNYRQAGIGNNFIFDQGLEAAPGFVGQPQLLMDATGRATVAFAAFATNWRLRTVDRPAGDVQSFGSVTEAIPPSSDVSQLEIGVGGDGTVMLAYLHADDRFYGTVRKAGATQFEAETGPVSPAGFASGEGIPTVDAGGKGLLSFSNETGGPVKYSIKALPYDDVPVASDLNVPVTAVQGVPVNFSVSPTDAWSNVTATEWTVDPGTARTGNQITHTYMTPGTRQVDVKLTDDLGNVTVTSANVKVTADKTPPKLTKVSIQKKKAKVGKKNAFRFATDDLSKIVITIKRTSKGKGKKAQGKIVKTNIAAGARKIGFRGKIGKKKLKPARYKATVVAIDQFGNRSKPKSVGFTILRK